MHSNKHKRNREIFVLDDDANSRETLSATLERAGCKVVCFANEAALRTLMRSRSPLCVFLDVGLPGGNGIHILKGLMGFQAPVITFSDQANIPMAVAAMSNGASDFIQKPFNDEQIVSLVEALLKGPSRRDGKSPKAKWSTMQVSGRRPFTIRERAVIDWIVSGLTSKEAAVALGISPRTIEAHRTNIMKKLGVKSSSELVRTLLTLASS